MFYACYTLNCPSYLIYHLSKNVKHSLNFRFSTLRPFFSFALQKQWSAVNENNICTLLYFGKILHKEKTCCLLYNASINNKKIQYIYIYANINNKNSIFRNRNSWRVTAYKILLKRMVKVPIFKKKWPSKKLPLFVLSPIFF